MKMSDMKNFLLILVMISCVLLFTSCNMFKPKYGCPTNGKNIGAEKLASGDPEAEKAARKAKKFRS